MTDRQNQNPYTLINTFTPVAGGIDALVALQLAEIRDMHEEATSFGWLGNEVYRSQDGASLIIVTRFRSREARERWAATERFRRHIEELAPLVKAHSSVAATFLAAYGDSSYST